MQSISPRRQLSAGVQEAPALQVSLQLLVSSHEPLEQGVPMSRNSSRGHAVLIPSQTSATSHSPAAARHSVPASTRRFSGHSALTPSQTSSRSQGPDASPHTAPALPGPALVHTGTPVEQSNTPSSQGLPVSHGMSQEGAPASKPTSSGGPASPGPASRLGTSGTDESIVPASLMGAAKQPRSLSQYSKSPHAPAMGMKMQAPSEVQTPVAQGALLMQSESATQPGSQAA